MILSTNFHKFLKVQKEVKASRIHDHLTHSSIPKNVMSFMHNVAYSFG